MSESDIAIVENMIREQWVGDFFVPLRGYVRVKKVRDGGLTALLIKKAATIADRYYRKKILEMHASTEYALDFEDLVVKWANGRSQ